MTAPKKSAPVAAETLWKQGPTTPLESGGLATCKVAAEEPHVNGRGRPYSVHRPAKSPVDAIRLFCLECCGSSLEFGREDAAVRDCPNEHNCSLWPYRFGKNPRHSRASAATVEKALCSTGKGSRTRREPEPDHGEG